MNRSTPHLPVGKLPLELLAELIGGLRIEDPGVIVGPGVGRDVAIVDCGGPEQLVVTADPITFATDALGYYAVSVNVNDIATSGGEPRWLTAILLLPEGEADEATVRDIWDQLSRAAADVGVTIIGGHTEVTATVNVPVICVQMLGTVPEGRYLTAGGVEVGDELVLVGPVAVEGTALLAREIPAKLHALGCLPQTIQVAAELLFDPGICVLDYARFVLGTCSEVHALHDPTEGGLATGLWEMALASQVGLRVEGDSIPLLAHCRDFCEKLGIDPLGLIASGCLLCAVGHGRAQDLVEQAHNAGLTAAAIGTAVPESAGLKLRRAGRWERLPRYDQDELTRVL